MRLKFLALPLALLMAACGSAPEVASRGDTGIDRYATATPELVARIDRAADAHRIPRALMHRVVQRESGYRPGARNGPYWGLMQILPQTARTMGFGGAPQDLLDPEVNLRYAGRYLRGAWLVADGDIDRAVQWYARGYYYEARDRCMLVQTGLAAREVNRRCG
ncbi:lytic transglycosylase domain-containing protein [Pararhodobacter sp. SW119]|uniref:lytic transglycosylase domain-containing protein n=1 Tax=Pararhodobacter sp. SW119 TaxID=2780075 RepID=UPI001AE07A31|nr:lytic transglycosylase domain-containing protein [Pararhodobacter sp. SW119]